MFVGRNFGSDSFASLLDIKICTAKETIGFTQGAHIVPAESPAFQPHLVDSANFRRVAVRDHKGRNILNDLCAAAEDSVPSNSAVLMHSAQTADYSIVFNNNMASESAVVGKDDMVSHTAVVSDVGIGKKVVVAADQGLRIQHRSAIHSTELSKTIVIANLQKSWLALIFQILRALPD